MLVLKQGAVIQQLIANFEALSRSLPLELFVLIGTFIEELFSPIPAFVVLVPAGAAANLQNLSPWYVLVLVLISGVGRIAGGSILYWLADKSENALLGKGKSFLGATHKDIEELGKRLSGNPVRDWLILFAMNATPIFPGAFLSLACGFIKVRFPMFITATFFGTLINSLFYLYLGYTGIEAVALLDNLELATQIVGLAIIALLIWWLVKKTRTKK